MIMPPPSPRDLMAKLGRELDPSYAANAAIEERRRQEREAVLQHFRDTIQRIKVIFQGCVGASTETVTAKLLFTPEKYGSSSNGLDACLRITIRVSPARSVTGELTYTARPERLEFIRRLEIPRGKYEGPASPEDLTDEKISQAVALLLNEVRYPAQALASNLRR